MKKSIYSTTNISNIIKMNMHIDIFYSRLAHQFHYFSTELCVQNLQYLFKHIIHLIFFKLSKYKTAVFEKTLTAKKKYKIILDEHRNVCFYRKCLYYRQYGQCIIRIEYHFRLAKVGSQLTPQRHPVSYLGERIMKHEYT